MPLHPPFAFQLGNTILKLILITALLVLTNQTRVEAQSPRAFYIGHSLSDQIPDMVQSLSNDDPEVSFSWAYQSIPGAPLRWQWDRKHAMDYTENPPQFLAFYNSDIGLPSGDFDVMVLTESVPRYLSIIDETYAYADSFMRYALTYNPDIQVYLYEDWHCILSGTPTGCDYDIDSNPWRQRLGDDLAMWESVVDTLNHRYQPANPVCLIPAGQGLALLNDSIEAGSVPGITSIHDLFSDNIHLNDIGKYFIACIHFAMIHRKSPVGLTEQTQHWWGGDLGAPSPALAASMQTIAWQTVINYPRSCVASTTSSSIMLGNDCLTIAPNPGHNIFRIDGNNGIYDVDILDASGMLYQTLDQRTTPFDIYLHAMPPGLYFIRITNRQNAAISIEKILKQ